ncbi:MAG: DUF2235 domain-containing protein [Rhizomicrobium sp.]
MGKNIVVCCDGTSNEYNYAQTNVVRLYATLVNDPARQVTFYHPGLGTMGPPGALTKFDNDWTRMAGLAFGRGIENDIRDAYCFLMQTYEDGDHVYLFGFSRGAYTARCLSAVLYLYGLLRKGNEPLVPYAVRMIVELGKTQTNREGPLGLAKGFRETFSRPCPVHFVGVWDTVSSVGWFNDPMKLPYTANSPEVAVGRHAVSIDERRAFFRDNLWRPSAAGPSGPQNVKQVWFAGNHSDVGGGYPIKECGLSQFALEWMLVEARNAGLLVDTQRALWALGEVSGSPYVKASEKQKVHDALAGWWRLAEFIPKPHYDFKTKTMGRRMNLFRRRTIPDGSRIHESAYLRGPSYAQFIPTGAIREPRVPFV